MRKFMLLAAIILLGVPPAAADALNLHFYFAAPDGSTRDVLVSDMRRPIKVSVPGWECNLGGYFPEPSLTCKKGKISTTYRGQPGEERYCAGEVFTVIIWDGQDAATQREAALRLIGQTMKNRKC